MRNSCLHLCLTLVLLGTSIHTSQASAAEAFPRRSELENRSDRRTPRKAFASFLVAMALIPHTSLRAEDLPASSKFWNGTRSDLSAPETGLEKAKFLRFGEDHQLTRATLDSSGQSDTPLVVHFFAYWCGPCKAELPKFLDALASKEGLELEEGGIAKFILVDVSQETDESWLGKSWDSYSRSQDFPKLSPQQLETLRSHLFVSSPNLDAKIIIRGIPLTAVYNPRNQEFTSIHPGIAQWPNALTEVRNSIESTR